MISQSLFTLLAAGTIFTLSCGKPPVSTLAGSLEVSARNEANETRMARVSAPVAGRITELNIVEGQNVKSGDLIALITSTQLSEAQANFPRAQLNRRQAERAVDRAKRLLGADVIGSAELLRREAELTQAISDLNAARDQLSLLGMPDSALGELEKNRGVRSISHVKATLDGTVLERPVTPGQVVQAAETTGVLAGLSTVWLVDAALSTVVKVLIEGVILVVIILFRFLGDLRSSIVVIGGLFTSTSLTLIVLPALYAFFEGKEKTVEPLPLPKAAS